ncbi:hypothetical protein ES703_69307 [subsurface metagenome]
MNKIKKFTYFSIPLIIIAIITAFFIDVKTVMIILFSLLLLKAYILYKEKIGQELVVAFIISIAIASYYFYEYTTLNVMIGNLNLFPVISWTFGLVVLREIYERVKWKHKFIAITVLYIVVLVILEYIGYNFLGIHLSSNFPGLWQINAMHSPLVLKIIYFAVGPLYLAITDYLKVK